MKINGEENLINNEELKELKEIDYHNSNDEDEKKNKEKEEIPEEEKQNIEKEEIQEKSELTIEQTKEEEKNKSNKDEKGSYIDEPTEPFGKKELEGLLLILNAYWVEFIGSISLIISLLIFGFLVLLFLLMISRINEEESGETLKIEEIIIFIVDKLGFKWFFFITMGNHLSVGFFSFATFTSILRDTKNIKKFYIVNSIKTAIYYLLSVIFLNIVLSDLFKEYFKRKIQEADINNEKVYKFFDILIDKLVGFLGGFLSTYNIFLEKIVFGTMYIFLFTKPKCCEGKKMIHFRRLVIIPILYTIISLILRALYNSYNSENKRILNINLFVLPLLLGSKITIYLFFISTLFFIKYISLKKDVFDGENEIKTKVFNKIGGRCFGVLGLLELIFGLFLPSCSSVGIGGKYLLILSAPIMSLYDYKKKYQLKFPCCKKGNMANCFKKVFLSIAYLIVIAFLFFLLAFSVISIAERTEFISYYIIKYYDLTVDVLDLLL